MGTVSVWEDEKVVKMGGGDGCTTTNVSNATELYTQKWLKWSILCMYILPHIYIGQYEQNKSLSFVR